MRYPGGKGGCFRQLINLIPPHEVYIETHLGGGNVLENKKLADHSIGVDVDPDVVASWVARREWRGLLEVRCEDATSFLDHFPWTGREFVYCDPPYLMHTRKSGRLYRFEMSESEHWRLLKTLTKVPVPVMISGYRSELYDDLLVGWRYLEFQSSSRGGPVTESVWLNYRPGPLHDYSHLGSGFRERERIRRQQNRWCARLAALPEQEQTAMLIELLDRASPTAAMEALIVANGEGGPRRFREVGLCRPADSGER